MVILEAELARSGTILGQSALGRSAHRWMAIPPGKQAFPAMQDHHGRLRGHEAGARWMGAHPS